MKDEDVRREADLLCRYILASRMYVDITGKLYGDYLHKEAEAVAHYAAAVEKAGWLLNALLEDDPDLARLARKRTAATKLKLLRRNEREQDSSRPR